MSTVVLARSPAAARSSSEPDAGRELASVRLARPERDPSGDLELMRGVTAGDPEAESALVRRVIVSVRARARSLTRSDADADDATQAALIEILKSTKSFRGEGTIEGWCDRIVVRTTLREQRRRARRLALIDDRVDPDRCSGVSQPGDILDGLRGFLAELSADRLQVLDLRAQGYSVDEIAARTEASPNTVKDRLRMARRQLRQSIRQREVVASVRRSTT